MYEAIAFEFVKIEIRYHIIDVHYFLPHRLIKLIIFRGIGHNQKDYAPNRRCNFLSEARYANFEGFLHLIFNLDY